jgi:hypothetical protein
MNPLHPPNPRLLGFSPHLNFQREIGVHQRRATVGGDGLAGDPAGFGRTVHGVGNQSICSRLHPLSCCASLDPLS